MGVQAPPAEPRFETIHEGVTALVVERPAVLPPTLDILLHDIVMHEHLAVRVMGFARACADTDHRLIRWIRGAYQRRDLRLSMCGDCGMVEVRDVSLDLLPGLRPGSLLPRRKDDIIGWYSGQRAANRVYF